MSNGIFLLLGTNVGNRASNLDNARKAIADLGKIISLSSTYQTEAWGKTDQPAFYNQAVEISTSFNPSELLEKILSIELELGRKREEKWGPRVIDIDILFYGEIIVRHKDLTIPHPGIPLRRFVLVPLCDIVPKMIHPELRKSIAVLLEECTDPLNVKKI